MSVVINGSAGVTTNSGAVYNGIASGTAVASTSGTSIDFTSIPSWVKRITVMLNGINISGSASYLIQIGAGSVTSSGYVSSSAYARASTGLFSSSTSGFVIATGSTTTSGSMQITLSDTNKWTSSHFVGQSAGGCVGGGYLALGGTLDRVRITTSNGTDTFTAGSINILYE